MSQKTVFYLFQLIIIGCRYHIMILSFLFSIVLHSKLSRIVLFTVILYIYGTYFIWLQHVPQIIQHVFLSIEKRFEKNWFDHEVHCSKVPFKKQTIVLFHKQEAKNNKTIFIYDSFETHLHTIELNLGRREKNQHRQGCINWLTLSQEFEICLWINKSFEESIIIYFPNAYSLIDVMVEK